MSRGPDDGLASWENSELHVAPLVIGSPTEEGMLGRPFSLHSAFLTRAVGRGIMELVG